MRFLQRTAAFKCLLLIAIASSLITLRGAFLTPESLDFIAHYLSDRPLAGKIFDIRGTDYNFYQAREVSYLFDFLDVHFIRACARMGFVHFYSATYYAALCLIVWIFLFFTSRLFPKAPRSLPYLLALVFLTSPVIFFSGFFYRSAKILTSLGLALVLGAVAWAAKTKPPAKKAFCALFIASLPLSFFDRQGFFMTAAMGGLSLAYGLFRKRIFWIKAVAAPAFLAAGLHCLYNFWIGPRLVLHFSGRPADLSYQKLPMAAYGGRFFSYFKAGGGIFFENLSQFFGNFGPWAAFVIFLWCALAMARRDWAKGLVFILALVLMVFMDSLMVLRLPTITWEETRLVYVWLPQMTAVLFGAAVALAPGARRLAAVFLLICLAGNVAALPRHWRVIQNGQLDFFIQAAPSIRACVKDTASPAADFDVNTPDKALSEDYIHRARRACALLRSSKQARSSDPAGTWHPNRPPVP